MSSETGDDQQFSWLTKYGQKFGINGNSVHVITSPGEFYQSLLEKAKSSRKRIVLASLYLGCGELEQAFVDSIHASARVCRDTCADPLHIQVLLDCNRGSRGTENSRTLLLPLVREFTTSVNVALYHTPDLRGMLKKMLPQRWDEIISLAHIKVYIFDDDLIISGANLSESYFTDRQDRYILLKNVPHVADYYHQLVRSIASMSFQLGTNDTLELHHSNTLHPYINNDKGRSYKKELARRVNQINKLGTAFRAHSDSQSIITHSNITHSNMSHSNITQSNRTQANTIESNTTYTDTHTNKIDTHLHTDMHTHTGMHANTHADTHTTTHTDTHTHTNRSSHTNTHADTHANTHTNTHSNNSTSHTDTVDHTHIDTWIYPLVQMRSIGIENDSQATELFFRKAVPGSTVCLASGYFNLTKHYIDVIINKSKADYNILTASPQANGFYGGSGISGSVPTAYTYIAREFYRSICENCQDTRIRLREYTRPRWTFHAKGLWYYMPGSQLPTVTFIGSPNFGYRSVYRDLESQVVLVTRNRQLQQQLHQEQLSLYSPSTEVTRKTFALSCRKVPLWAKTVTKIIRSFF